MFRLLGGTRLGPYARIFNPRAPSSPLEYHGNGDATHLDVYVYRTVALNARRGRVPEDNSVRYLAQALRHAGYNYTIRFGFEPLHIVDRILPIEDPREDCLDQLKDLDPAPEADMALVIADRHGGGRSGPKYLTTAGRWYRRRMPLKTEIPSGATQPGFPWKHVINLLHEFGHALGGAHSDNMTEPPSLLWTESGIRGFDKPAP